ncbi:DUF4387 domain-containing protein [Actinacidiphila oryziradicis]|uniref:DUF4387 domain-containing protein n=2 Tax=Actinacidiphila oryziradicis TaxID=2571141 RepID=A0A4U0SW15_9ACTN|nr:DUF4387 domain-containing protein [Actinacidiphila oryziradicis]
MERAPDPHQGAGAISAIRASIRALYGADPDRILIVHHDRAQAIKVSMPRPVRQGDLADCDSYGGQQYAPWWTSKSRHRPPDHTRCPGTR